MCPITSLSLTCFASLMWSTTDRSSGSELMSSTHLNIERLLKIQYLILKTAAWGWIWIAEISLCWRLSSDLAISSIQDLKRFISMCGGNLAVKHRHSSKLQTYWAKPNRDNSSSQGKALRFPCFPCNVCPASVLYHHTLVVCLLLNWTTGDYSLALGFLSKPVNS